MKHKKDKSKKKKKMNHIYDETSHVRRRILELLAGHIERYQTELLSVLIIPEEVSERESDIHDANLTVKKLIRKLKAGDSSVFKDPDDWEFIDNL